MGGVQLVLDQIDALFVLFVCQTNQAFHPSVFLIHIFMTMSVKSSDRFSTI